LYVEGLPGASPSLYLYSRQLNIVIYFVHREEERKKGMRILLALKAHRDSLGWIQVLVLEVPT
jgi:hypothetical protein